MANHARARVDFGASYTDEGAIVETPRLGISGRHTAPTRPPPVKRQCPSICAWPDSHTSGPMLSSQESLRTLAGNAP